MSSPTIATKKTDRLRLGMIFFLLGAFTMILQSILLREMLVVALGNEIIFGLILCLWFLGIFLGAQTGGFLANKNRNPELFFSSIILFLCVFSLFSVTGVRQLGTLTGTSAGSYIPLGKVAIWGLAFISPLGLAIGMLFPFSAKLPVNWKRPRVYTISRAYILESWGALLGGLLFTFILIERFNPFLILMGLSLPLLGILFILIQPKFPFPVKILWIFMFIFNILGLFPDVHQAWDRWTVQKRWQGFSSSPLLESRDSRYQNIAVGKYQEQYQIYGNGQLAVTFPENEDRLIEATLLYCQHPHPRRILIIGDAITGLGQQLLGFPVEKLISVETDPVWVQTIQKYASGSMKGLFDQSRFSLLIGDGRKMLKTWIQDPSQRPIQTGFDLVFLSLPEPSTLLLNRYYTREFFLDLQRIMSPDGVLALRLSSSESNPRGSVIRYVAVIYQTLKSVFPNIAISPGIQNYFFSSQQIKAVTTSPTSLQERYDRSGHQPAKLGLIFQTIFPPDQTQMIKKILDQYQPVKLNTDKRPIGSYYFSQIQSLYSGTDLTSGLLFLENLRLWNILAVLFLIFLGRWTWEKFFSQPNPERLHRHVMGSVMIAGFAGLSLELVAIYTFQIALGNLYQAIGLILAFFMAGLPLGASLSNRFLARRLPDLNQCHRRLLLILLQMSLLPMFFLVLGHKQNLFGLNSALWIFTFIFLLGLVLGSIFPLAYHISILSGATLTQAAGRIDALDHLGAASGAFLSGSLIIPLGGISGICWLVLFLTLGNIFFLWRSRETSKNKRTRHDSNMQPAD